jgi:hypothetical protein
MYETEDNNPTHVYYKSKTYDYWTMGKWSEKDRVFKGTLGGMARDIVPWEAPTSEAVPARVEEAIQIYLNSCDEINICPETPERLV